MKIQDARERIEKVETDNGITVSKVFVSIVENKYGRDSGGNLTCHFVCYLCYEYVDSEGDIVSLNDSIIAESGYYREQVGFDDSIHGGAESKLLSLGYELKMPPFESEESKNHRNRYYTILSW